jgi:hypothetical protein
MDVIEALTGAATLAASVAQASGWEILIEPAPDGLHIYVGNSATRERKCLEWHVFRQTPYLVIGFLADLVSIAARKLGDAEVVLPPVVDGRDDRIKELELAVAQYRNDLIRPLAPDSITRRLAMIFALIGPAE